jgi:aspartate kinase
MIVFKFGGASVKSAKAVKNVADILKRYHEDQIVIVVSAMGKTTNAMEVIADHYFHKRKQELKKAVEERKKYHQEIVDELFPEKGHPFHAEFSSIFEELEARLSRDPTLHYDFDYDQIVPFGEMISTKIISAYLNESDIENRWMDIRKYLKSNNTFREARIDWELSGQLVPEGFNFKNARIYITQGFVAK